MYLHASMTCGYRFHLMEDRSLADDVQLNPQDHPEAQVFQLHEHAQEFHMAQTNLCA